MTTFTRFYYGPLLTNFSRVMSSINVISIRIIAGKKEKPCRTVSVDEHLSIKNRFKKGMKTTNKSSIAILLMGAYILLNGVLIHIKHCPFLKLFSMQYTTHK